MEYRGRTLYDRSRFDGGAAAKNAFADMRSIFHPHALVGKYCRTFRY